MADGSNFDHETLLDLLERQGTLEQVSTYLRQKGLTHSAGSWQDMKQQRLRKHLEENSINSEDLLDILQITEEHGNQHVFLFRLVPNKDISYLFDSRIEDILKANSLPGLGERSVVNTPDKPTIVEIRKENHGEDQSIVIKIVEKRFSLSRSHDEESAGKFIVTYDQIPYRGVNILRITNDGTAEVRLQSFRDASSYSGYSESIWNAVKPLIKREWWADVNLVKFKHNLFDPAKRSEMQARFGLRLSQHTNGGGIRLQVASPAPDISMYDNSNTVATLDQFQNGDKLSLCEKVSIVVKPSEDFSRAVNVVLGGSANEFFITQKLTKREYENVLKSIRDLNK